MPLKPPPPQIPECLAYSICHKSKKDNCGKCADGSEEGWRETVRVKMREGKS